MKSRIIFLLLSAAILAGAFTLSGRLESGEDAPAQSGDEVTIAVATDLHYIAPELTDKGEYFTNLVTDADGKVMLYIDELVRAFAEQIIAEQPDALILSGDLSFNGETASHEALASILSEVEASGVPVYVMPGNHDMNSSMAARFEGDGYELVSSPSEGEFAQIYYEFGYSEAISRDEKSLSYAAQIAPGLRLVMLDVNTRSNPGYVLDSTFDWLEEQLRDAREAGERVIAVSHQNIYPHNNYFTSGYIIGNGGTLHSLYAEYGVLCNLAGHIHLQHCMSEGGVPEIVTSSLAVNPNQYGVLTVRGRNGQYNTESVDVSSWAEAEGLTNEDLLNFDEYSERFFYDTAVQQGLDELGGEGERETELARFYAMANTLYFAGLNNQIEWDEDAMDEWSERGFFIPRYLETIRLDSERNYTRFEF